MVRRAASAERSSQVFALPVTGTFGDAQAVECPSRRSRPEFDDRSNISIRLPDSGRSENIVNFGLRPEARFRPLSKPKTPSRQKNRYLTRLLGRISESVESHASERTAAR